VQLTFDFINRRVKKKTIIGLILIARRNTVGLL